MLEFVVNMIKDVAKTSTVRVLKQGPIPGHVAFIMDGNRRYARRGGMATVTEGHRVGFFKMDEILDYCIDFGIPEATMYMFSVENFKRSKEEVLGLMDMITELIPEYSKKMKRIGVKAVFIGNWLDTFPSEIKSIFADLMFATKDNTTITVNFALSYTGRQEIVDGVRNIISEVSKGTLSVSDIDVETLEQCFQVYPIRPVDLLLRTSGESRLSDFLLWQCTHAYLDFVQVEWPEMNFRQFAFSIWRYQRHVLLNAKTPGTTLNASELTIPIQKSAATKNRQKTAIESIRSERWQTLELCAETM